MCGIAGLLGRADDQAVLRMLDWQRHRGPDGRRVWASPGSEVTLGHDRLAIIDVLGGAQPLPNEDESLWLILNGEIYNYRELRTELAERHTFRTGSDAEVVLHLFEEEGPACVRRLDGMFAFAIWGKETGLFLARDPVGIKPLYYGYDRAGGFRFASEIKALLDEVPKVSEFPAGSGWMVGSASAPTRHYVLPWPQPELTDIDMAVDLLDQTLTQAVIKRLMSDVPLGVFLSGGLDSSLIAAIVRQHVSGDLHSFSVGLEGSADLQNARRMAEYIGTVHHERVLAPDEIIEALPYVIDGLESCDPALVRSSIPTYFVSEMASQHVKVVLSGEGADELFAGYHYLAEFGQDLAAELRAITFGLHNSNLQRVDRMTMAHGLEGRVPFLDTMMIDLASRIDPALKRRDGEGKWILRKMAERYLPMDIVWRTKEKFAIGTGVGPLLERHAEAQTGGMDKEFRTPEEWLYWSHFRSRFGREDVLAGMGRSRSLNPGQRWVSVV